MRAWAEGVCEAAVSPPVLAEYHETGFSVLACVTDSVDAELLRGEFFREVDAAKGKFRLKKVTDPSLLKATPPEPVMISVKHGALFTGRRCQSLLTRERSPQ